MHHDTCAVARYMRAIFRRPTEQLKRGFGGCIHGEKIPPIMEKLLIINSNLAIRLI
jgi:hypothetical protein